MEVTSARRSIYPLLVVCACLVWAGIVPAAEWITQGVVYSGK